MYDPLSIDTYVDICSVVTKLVKWIFDRARLSVNVQERYTFFYSNNWVGSCQLKIPQQTLV